MVVDIPDGGLVLESSAKAMAGLPMQAFSITLSDDMIEDMINCVQNGQDIQLSLGGSPAFLFNDQEVLIPGPPEYFDYDVFYSNSERPTVINKLQYPAMSIFNPLKHRPPQARAPQPSKAGKAGRAKSNSIALSDRDLVLDDEDDAIANLKNSYAKAEAEKRENASTLVDGILPAKGAKAKPGKVKLLGAPTAATTSRSHPGSPALSAITSPSLGPTTTTAQDRVKQQRFPIIHELAVQEMTFNELLSKYEGGTEQEFTAALNKVADFDGELQRWALKKLYWKDLDVFEYNYGREEDRQQAIEHAIKQYDKMRLGASDPLWQKLLPKSERGKGVCLSKLQAAIANKASASARTSTQKTDASSLSGADSEKDDSASSTTKKTKGGEPMSRSSSQTLKKKPSASEAQAKRLLSNPKKSSAASAKASPKVSPTKPTAASKAVGAKGGRVLSKEFISDSDSDDDEVPLSSSMPKTKTAAMPASAPASKPVDRPAEKPRVAEKSREPAAPKTKAGLAARPAAKEKDTIRAQVVAKPAKAPVKRQRDDDDDDSSSSGTPLSKRIKPGAKAPLAAASSNKRRATSDASQGSRGNGSGGSVTKSKNTSPVKSSPLASSPPTNASDLELDRSATARGRERDRDADRDTIVSRAGSSTSTGSSISVGDGGPGPGKKRPVEDSSREGNVKRQRLSEEILNKANKFKHFYSRYETLHREIRASEDPNPERVADLMDMHLRLKALKREIYEQAPVEV